MSYRNIDESIARTANPGTVHAYLRSLGWYRREGRPEVAVYAAPDGGLAQAILPLDDHAPDYAPRIIDAVWAVAEATRLDVQTVLGRFLGINATPTPRRLVLCFDGWELRSSTTNVRRFWRVLDQDPLQIRYYSGAEQFGGAKTTRLLGGTLAAQRVMLYSQFAVSQDVANAYRFLIRHYQPGDKINLIGFGRGGYTARILAGLLHVVGLLEKGAEDTSDFVVRHYMFSAMVEPELKKRELAVLRSDFGRPATIEFLGVWDSTPPTSLFGTLPRLPFTAANPSVRHVRHAIALDERRALMRVDHFHRVDGEQDVMEVWFPGVHSDVGGGYPEKESGLAKVALRWMVGEAAQVGLRFNEARLHAIMGRDGECAPPDPGALLHNSMVGAWRALEYFPMRVIDSYGGVRWDMHRMRPRMIRSKALVHEAVFERKRRVGGYVAANVPENAIVVQDQPLDARQSC